jgi:predicted DsbA family dithiol-disulfide isomerase
LLVACHSHSLAMESAGVLLGAVAQAGLEVTRASQILTSDEFSAEVRAAEALYTGLGIHSVPAVIINDRHLISGGQPAAVFEQALRQIGATASPTL